MTELARRFRIDGGLGGPADPVVVNEQFFKNGFRPGEERLMLAVLQDAVRCFQEHVLAQHLWEKTLLQEAENWIFEKNTNWFFSFENICETLQLNPDYIRRGLLVWKNAKRKSHSETHVKIHVLKATARHPNPHSPSASNEI
jgi:hypothetical protein